MIKQIIEGLKITDYYDANKLIQFAKGSHKAPESISELRDVIKRRRNGGK